MKFHHFVLCTGLTFAGVGCTDTLVPDVVPPRGALDQAYWSLTMEYPAVNLSMTPPHNTVQLVAIPRNALGEIIEGATDPVFSVLDTARLSFTPDGLLTARSTGSNILVVATLQIGNVTHSSTTLVRITATAPARPLSTFSVQPAISDSAVWSWGGNTKAIQPTALDAENGRISGLQVAYTSSNTRVATIQSNGTTNATLEGRSSGTVWIIARTYAYGVHKVDSVEYRIGLPLQQQVAVVREINGVNSSTVAFYPPTVTIGVGGYILWSFPGGGWTEGTGTPGIVFEDPTAAKRFPGLPFVPPGYDNQDGNILARIGTTGLLVAAFRYFTSPGTYIYHDDKGNISARIIVAESSGTDNP